ncbi:MAG: hypothetical protein OEU54_14570 [Gemmatimonadota bacterium]|nr:hypothetical protein [Gemmatimonadota bacterium]
MHALRGGPTRGVRLATLVATALCAAAPLAAQVPAGWLLSGANADLYRMRVDRDVARSGEASLRLEARGNRRNDEWAVAVQLIDAAPWRGQRIRLSGHLRSDDLGSGGLWLRVDGILDGEAAQLVVDNAEDRRVSDETDWTLQEIVVDVPAESVTILFGAMINGDGELWVDGLTLEPAPDADVTAEVTNTVLGGEYQRPLGMLPTPVNLDFEIELEG